MSIDCSTFCSVETSQVKYFRQLTSIVLLYFILLNFRSGQLTKIKKMLFKVFYNYKYHSTLDNKYNL